MNIINIKETKELIKRYNTITLEEIKACDAPLPESISRHAYQSLFSLTSSLRANKLTGFGATRDCTLCQAVVIRLHGYKSFQCDKCIHSINFRGDIDTTCPCATKFHTGHKTYFRINSANTPTKLKNAFRARAKYLQSLLDQL
jgi:hypothetical protein